MGKGSLGKGSLQIPTRGFLVAICVLTNIPLPVGQLAGRLVPHGITGSQGCVGGKIPVGYLQCSIRLEAGRPAIATGMTSLSADALIWSER